MLEIRRLLSQFCHCVNVMWPFLIMILPKHQTPNLIQTPFQTQSLIHTLDQTPKQIEVHWHATEVSPKNKFVLFEVF